MLSLTEKNGMVFKKERSLRRSKSIKILQSYSSDIVVLSSLKISICAPLNPMSVLFSHRHLLHSLDEWLLFSVTLEELGKSKTYNIIIRYIFEGRHKNFIYFINMKTMRSIHLVYSLAYNWTQAKRLSLLNSRIRLI